MQTGAKCAMNITDRLRQQERRRKGDYTPVQTTDLTVSSHDNETRERERGMKLPRQKEKDRVSQKNLRELIMYGEENVWRSLKTKLIGG